mmetsp:Transcript_125251/g.400356  ORF Transcript_125251/g.400356 Transcript_125251/m.400356 type:complete len:180 (-) Transcript_125251:1294-1833(-)
MQCRAAVRNCRAMASSLASGTALLVVLFRASTLQAVDFEGPACNDGTCDAQEELSVLQSRISAEKRWERVALEQADFNKSTQAQIGNHKLASCKQINPCLSMCHGLYDASSKPESFRNFGQNIKYAKAAFAPSSVTELVEHLAASMHDKHACFMPVGAMHSWGQVVAPEREELRHRLLP